MEGEHSFQEYTLENGLRVGLQRLPTQTIDGRLRFFAGSLNDPEGKEGAHHFLEHVMVSAGTQKYTPQEQLRIGNTITNGNAFTSLDSMGFTGSFLPKNLETFLSLNADVGLHPRMDAEYTEIARQIVLREIGEFSKYDDPNHLKFLEVLGGEQLRDLNAAAKFGERGVVESLEINELRELHSKNFSANNADLILTGALPEDTEQLIAYYLGGMPRGEYLRKPLPLISQIKSQEIIEIPAPYLIHREVPSETQARISVGIPAPSFGADDYFYFSTMINWLSREMTDELRNSACNYSGIRSQSHQSLYDESVYYITLDALANKCDEATTLVFQLFDQLREQGIDQKKLNEIKELLEYRAVTTLDTNRGALQVITSRWDYGYDLKDEMSLAENMTPEDIKQVAQKYLPANMEEGAYVMMKLDPFKTLDPPPFQPPLTKDFD